MKARFNELISSSKPVLVDFSAEWCGPCKMMAPVLTQLKEKLGDRIRIIKIDVDRNPEIAAEYRIQSVPSLMLFQNGATVWSGVGVMPASHLENIIYKSCAVEAN